MPCDRGQRCKIASSSALRVTISLILSPGVSYHCVGINRTAKHRRFQLQVNGNQCRVQSERMRIWRLEMGQLRIWEWSHNGAIKRSSQVDRDNIQGVSKYSGCLTKSCKQNYEGFVAPPTRSHLIVYRLLNDPVMKHIFSIGFFLLRLSMIIDQMLPSDVHGEIYPHST